MYVYERLITFAAFELLMWEFFTLSPEKLRGTIKKITAYNLF